MRLTLRITRFIIFSSSYFFLAIFSCSEGKQSEYENERLCECPMGIIPDELVRIDTSMSVSSKTQSGGAEILLEGSLKKIVEGYINFNGGLEAHEVSRQTRVVLEKIRSDHPKFADEKFHLDTRRLIFCTYHKILCQDTSVSDEKLRILSLEKLEIIDQEIGDFRNQTKEEEIPRVNNTSVVSAENENVLHPVESETTVDVVVIFDSSLIGGDLFIDSERRSSIESTTLMVNLTQGREYQFSVSKNAVNCYLSVKIEKVNQIVNIHKVTCS